MRARESIQKRIASLEIAVAALQDEGKQPWWKAVAGSFAGDPVFTEAMKLGREYRASARPKRNKPIQKNLKLIEKSRDPLLEACRDL